jgi:hypothetical protein
MGVFSCEVTMNERSDISTETLIDRLGHAAWHYAEMRAEQARANLVAKQAEQKYIDAYNTVLSRIQNLEEYVKNT